MKIKNTPSNEFYKEMYSKVEQFLDTKKSLKDAKIIVKNVIGDKEYLAPKFMEIGHMKYTKDKKHNRLKYTINLAELNTLEFGNPEFSILIKLRYEEYLEGLCIPLTPEAITLLTFLHELGHIDFIEEYMDTTECDVSVLSIASYTNCLSSFYSMTMKPWEFAHLSTMNMNHIMFNSIEGYPELFSLKYFPRFIPLLKRFGLCEK